MQHAQRLRSKLVRRLCGRTLLSLHTIVKLYSMSEVQLAAQHVARSDPNDDVNGTPPLLALPTTLLVSKVHNGAGAVKRGKAASMGTQLHICACKQVLPLLTNAADLVRLSMCSQQLMSAVARDEVWDARCTARGWGPFDTGSLMHGFCEHQRLLCVLCGRPTRYVFTLLGCRLCPGCEHQVGA
jgi:hypothetical protein